MPRGPRRRRGHSSVRNRAVATATGTPMISAMADETIVPKSSGHAPNCRRDTSQSAPKVKPRTPNFEKASLDSAASLMKK